MPVTFCPFQSHPAELAAYAIRTQTSGQPIINNLPIGIVVLYSCSTTTAMALNGQPETRTVHFGL
eukprot:2406584-Amphidinium_carterae.1